jgi:hypothetical protein
MDGREYLVKAQEAEAMANSAQHPHDRQLWEQIAHEYRNLAQAVVEMTRIRSEIH